MKRRSVLMGLILGVALMIFIGAKITTNVLKIGNKTAEDVAIEFDVGSANNPVFKWDNAASKLKFTNDGSNFFDIGSGGGGGGSSVNLLVDANWNFENGTSNWTESGSASFSIDTTTPLFDGKSGVVDFTASGETLKSDAVTIERGLYGTSCLITFYYKWPTGTADNIMFTVKDGSNNALFEQVGLAKASISTKAQAAFICPTSGTLYLELEAQADTTNDFKLDNVWLGSDYRIGSALPSSEWIAFTPTTTWTSNVTWTGFYMRGIGNTMNISYTGTVTGTPTTAVLDVTIPDNKTINTSLLSSGTNTNGHFGTVISHQSGSGDPWHTAQVVYNSTTTLTAKAPVGDRAASITQAVPFAWGAGDTVQINAYNIPIAEWTGSSQTVTLDTQGMYWSGYHDATCLFSRNANTYADYADDGTCALVEQSASNFGTVTSYGSKKPGVVFTPRRTGVYQICAQFDHRSDATILHSMRLTDGTIIYSATQEQASNVGTAYRGGTLCGIFEANSLAQVSMRLEGKCSVGTCDIGPGGGTAAISWTIIPITQNFPQAVVLPLMKYQTRLLTGNITAADKSKEGDLDFNNLVIGKIYKIHLRALLRNRAASVKAYMSHNGSTIIYVENTKTAGTDEGYFTHSDENIFVATATSITFETDITGGSYILSTAAPGYTKATLEEYNYHGATTQWTP